MRNYGNNTTELDYSLNQNVNHNLKYIKSIQDSPSNINDVHIMEDLEIGRRKVDKH